MSAKATGANATPNGDAKHRQHNDGSSGRAFTVEQKAAVIRIKRCSPTAFYEILGLEEVKTTCGEGEIKKAYRKLSLLTHPDKNGYDGADDAFKSRIFPFYIIVYNGIAGGLKWWSVDRVLTCKQWYREPSKSSPTPTRKQNTTDSAETQITGSQALHQRAHHRSAISREVPVRRDRVPCGKKRYRRKRCSGSSLAEEWVGSVGLSV